MYNFDGSNSMPLNNHITQDINGRRLTYALTLVQDEPIQDEAQDIKSRKLSLAGKLCALGASFETTLEATGLDYGTLNYFFPEAMFESIKGKPSQEVFYGTPTAPVSPTPIKEAERVVDESIIQRLYGRRLGHGDFIINEKPIPDDNDGSKGQKNRVNRITRRLYELGASRHFIQEVTNLCFDVIDIIVPELAPRPAGQAEPTKQTEKDVNLSQEVFHGTPVAPRPPDSGRMRAIGIVGGERVYLHFVDGPEPGYVVGKKCLLNPHAEPSTPSLKKRLIDEVLIGQDPQFRGHNGLYLADDLKPAIKARALETFNGFQGTPKEKAIQAVIHAHTELSTGI